MVNSRNRGVMQYYSTACRIHYTPRVRKWVSILETGPTIELRTPFLLSLPSSSNPHSQLKSRNVETVGYLAMPNDHKKEEEKKISILHTMEEVQSRFKGDGDLGRGGGDVVLEND